MPSVVKFYHPKNIICCCSVAQFCLTFCDPVDCIAHQASSFSTTSWHLLKLMSIESVMTSTHLILHCPFSPCLQSFPVSECFPMGQLFTSDGQSIGASTSASVLLMNIRMISSRIDRFDLLLFKRLSRVFSSTTV